MMKIKSTKGFSLLSTIISIGAIISLAAGGWFYYDSLGSDEEFDLETLPDCANTTSHGSCIKNGVDEELVGSWTLASQTITSPAGTKAMPSSGRTLTFNLDGSYNENYSTENIPDTTVPNPVHTITSHCEISGILSGTHKEEAIWDLDESTTINELHITLREGAQPEVTCTTDTGGSGFKSSAASTPLERGVNYFYTIDETQSVLTITQNKEQINVTNTYIFTR